MWVLYPPSQSRAGPAHLSTLQSMGFWDSVRQGVREEKACKAPKWHGDLLRLRVKMSVRERHPHHCISVKISEASRGWDLGPRTPRVSRFSQALQPQAAAEMLSGHETFPQRGRLTPRDVPPVTAHHDAQVRCTEQGTRCCTARRHRHPASPALPSCSGSSAPSSLFVKR